MRRTVTIDDSEFEDMLGYIEFLEDKFGNHWEEFVQAGLSVREAPDEEAKHWEACE
tara:strand:+ start:122 stop:289 length:168 start_codon:yes stop_codon:yes gene_type:complete